MPLWDRLSMEDDPRRDCSCYGRSESHFSDPKRIPYSYAGSEGAGTMDLNEMWMLAKDTKLLDGKMTLHSVQQLFLATADGLDASAASASSGKGKSGRSRSGFSAGVAEPGSCRD